MVLKLKPSSRVKRVYLLLEAKSRVEVDKHILDYLGTLGWAKASPLFVEGGKADGRVILAIDRKQINDVRAAFEASKGVKVLRVSSTLKGLNKKT